MNSPIPFPRACALAALTASVVLTACSTGPKTRAGHPAFDPRDNAVSHLHPALQRTVGQFALLIDAEPLSVEGYGIVAELPGTGSPDMPPSVRDILTDMLYKAGAASYTRGTENISPEKILQSNLIAAVEVRGAIPPLAKRGDSFDLVVSCLPNSQATSLSGGLLWTSELKTIGLTADTHNDTHPIAVGRGPVFLAGPVAALLGDTAATQPANARHAVRVGRIIGGGRVAEDRPVRLQLFTPAFPTAAAIERAINSRFPGRDKCASADSDSIISLNIPAEYAAEPMEFIELVKHMYLVQESPGFSERKAAELIQALKDCAAPPKDLSLALQALGRSVLPDFIQPQYTASDPAVRFWCARAGAGLQDVGGMIVLQDFARQANSPFQGPAIAAITQFSRGGDTDRASLTLLPLLNSKNNADRIRGYEGLLAINSPAVKQNSVGRKFWLDIVPSNGPPLIFVTQSEVPRIALIGRTIKLSPGLVYVSPDSALTISVPEEQATGSDVPSTVLTASANTTTPIAAAPSTQPAPIPQNVTLYWVPPSGDRGAVNVKTSTFLSDIIARIGWIPDPRIPLDPKDPYIGASYQRVTEMLASLCKDQSIEAQFMMEPAPKDPVRSPTDILNSSRPEGHVEPAAAPAAPATLPASPRN